MLAAIIILSILLLICIFIITASRRQISHICRQLAFKKTNATNMLITSNAGSMHGKLITLINDNLKKQDDIINEFQTNDNILKETITNLSHDIRTPLTSLDGYFQLLQTCEDEQTKAQYYEIIKGRIASLGEILEELFTYTRLQDKGFETAFEKVNFSQVFIDTALGFYHDFKSRSITPELSIEDEEIYVNADAYALKRVFQNVIKNALVHGEEYVSMSLRASDNKAVLKIANRYDQNTDTDTEKVFDRFYKADSSRSNISTGLGLSIAKGLTDKMNGNIKAYKENSLFVIEISFDRI